MSDIQHQSAPVGHEVRVIIYHLGDRVRDTNEMKTWLKEALLSDGFGIVDTYISGVEEYGGLGTIVFILSESHLINTPYHEYGGVAVLHFYSCRGPQDCRRAIEDFLARLGVSKEQYDYTENDLPIDPQFRRRQTWLSRFFLLLSRAFEKVGE